MITITGDKDPGINGTRVWLQLDSWDEPRPADGGVNTEKTWSIDVELAEGTNKFVLFQETGLGFCQMLLRVRPTSCSTLSASFLSTLSVPDKVIVQPGGEPVATVISGDREKGSVVSIDGVEKVDDNTIA